MLQTAARWTDIYVNINPVSDFEQLCKSIAGYSDSEDGIVAWKQRVALLEKNSIARIPPNVKQTDHKPKLCRQNNHKQAKKGV